MTVGGRAAVFHPKNAARMGKIMGGRRRAPAVSTTAVAGAHQKRGGGGPILIRDFDISIRRLFHFSPLFYFNPKIPRFR